MKMKLQIDNYDYIHGCRQCGKIYLCQHLSTLQVCSEQCLNEVIRELTGPLRIVKPKLNQDNRDNALDQ
jgi:hypothetical protein